MFWEASSAPMLPCCQPWSQEACFEIREAILSCTAFVLVLTCVVCYNAIYALQLLECHSANLHSRMIKGHRGLCRGVDGRCALVSLLLLRRADIYPSRTRSNSLRLSSTHCILRICHHSSYTHIPSPRRLSGLDQGQHPPSIVTMSCKCLNISGLLPSRFLLSPCVACCWDGVGSRTVGWCSGVGSSRSSGICATIPSKSSSLIKGWLPPISSSLLSSSTYSLHTPACMYTALLLFVRFMLLPLNSNSSSSSNSSVKSIYHWVKWGAMF